MCSPESSDVVRCVEGGSEGVCDGLEGDLLEVVEAGFLLRDLTGEGVAVIKEMRLRNVRVKVVAQRKRRNGEAMLLERVVPADKEALEIAQSVMAVF